MKAITKLLTDSSKILLSIPFWLIVEICIFLPLYAIGALVVPVLAARKAWTLRPSKYYRDRSVYVWKGGPLTWIWGNEEDGVTGADWYRNEHSDWTLPRAARNWFFRNPVNNLRFAPLLTAKLNASKIGYKGTVMTANGEEGWFLCWQGIYANYYYARRIGKKLFYFRIGWKMEPEDAAGIPEDDYRAGRAGIVFHCTLYK
jgi:hypothetical protein